MIAIFDRELIIVVSTVDYYEIRYRLKDKKESYYGYWERTDKGYEITIRGKCYFVTNEDFQSLSHEFKTKYANGKKC